MDKAMLKMILLAIVTAMAAPAMAADPVPIGGKGAIVHSALGCLDPNDEQKPFDLANDKVAFGKFEAAKILSGDCELLLFSPCSSASDEKKVSIGRRRSRGEPVWIREDCAV
jgi:hypothetical protein